MGEFIRVLFFMVVIFTAILVFEIRAWENRRIMMPQMEEGVRVAFEALSIVFVTSGPFIKIKLHGKDVAI